MQIKEIKKFLSEIKDHALVNICCSGNKCWSELASKEYLKRVKNKTHKI